MAKCTACKEEFPGLDKHHLIPVEYGGKEKGQTIDICQNCHDSIHRFGNDDTTNLEDVPSYLITHVAIVKEMKKRFEAGETEARDKRNKIMLDLSPQEREMMLWLKNHLNSSSQTNTIKTCLRIVFEQSIASNSW